MGKGSRQPPIGAMAAAARRFLVGGAARRPTMECWVEVVESYREGPPAATVGMQAARVAEGAEAGGLAERAANKRAAWLVTVARPQAATARAVEAVRGPSPQGGTHRSRRARRCMWWGTRSAEW